MVSFLLSPDTLVEYVTLSIESDDYAEVSEAQNGTVCIACCTSLKLTHYFFRSTMAM